jgi:hypothetical protein
MPENQYLARMVSSAQPLFRAHVIPARGLLQHAYSSHTPPPFACHYSTHPVHRWLVMARRLALDELLQEPQHSFFAATQDAKQILDSGALRRHRVAILTAASGAGNAIRVRFALPP